MSTTVVMASVASSQAAIASAAAARAKADMCKATMPNFDAKTATVSQMREYAECVQTLHPDEIGADAVIVFKVLFVIALAGMVGAAWRERHFGLGDSIFAGFMGFVSAPMVVGFVGAVIYGIRWLFS